MATRGSLITKADLDALATLATAKLLPIVNANIDPTHPATATGKWNGYWQFDAYGFDLGATTARSFYDKDAGNYSPVPAGSVGIAYPQPDYSFNTLSPDSRDAVFSEINRIFGDAMLVVFGNNGAAWTGAAGIFHSQNALVSGPWVVGVNDSETFPIPPWFSSFTESSYDGELYCTVNGMLTFKNVSYFYSPLDVIDDITINNGWRLDYATQTGADGGVRSTQTFAASYAFSQAGELEAFIFWPFTGSGNPTLADFTLTDDSGLAEWEIRQVGAAQFLLVAKISYAATVGGALNFTLTALCPAAFQIDAYYVGPGSGTPPYLVTGYSVSRIYSAGASNFTTVPVIHPNGQGAKIQANDNSAVSGFTLNGSASSAFWKLSDANVKGVWVANTLPCPGMNVFLDQDIPPFVGKYSFEYAVSPGYYDFGVAVGPAWSSSGNNFVENVPDGYPDGVGLPYASSMRQFAEMEYGRHIVNIGGYDIDIGPAYNFISQALQPKPTPYLCRRDTDTIPFNLGFNPNEITQIVAGQVFPANRAGAFTWGASIPANCTGLKIRLLQSGTALKAWRNGVLSYGTPLGGPLEIYVSRTEPIVWNNPASYDFKVTGDSVTVPGDGGAAYLASLLNGGVAVYISNPTGADITADVFIEYTIGAETRQFFPKCREAFSYNIDGTPGRKRALIPVVNPQQFTTQNKDVPQSGYCIYKIRALRLPVANAAGVYVRPSSGNKITVEVGQNVLQPDGTIAFRPFDSNGSVGAGDANTGGGDTNTGAGGTGNRGFTITIPPNAGDSGYVEVFWPVLSGNELVWRCAEQIMFEASVNWQPIFFNQMYGLGPSYSLSPFQRFLIPKPTAFQYALDFTNYFSVTNSGYLQPKSPAGYDSLTHVHFPMSKNLYDDLTNLLNQL